MKITDLDSVYEIACSYLYCNCEITDKKYSLFVSHPIFFSVYYPIKFGDEIKLVNIMDKPKYLELARKQYIDIFARIDKPGGFLVHIRKPYMLAFLRDTKDYLSESDFADMLNFAWTSSENPNDDVNVKIPTLIKWFRSADKKSLMNTEDYNKYMSIDGTVTVYRGVGINRNPVGLSWTFDMDTAFWFANRFGDGGYIEYATVRKDDVLAYFGNRNESEVVVDTANINIEILNKK